MNLRCNRARSFFFAAINLFFWIAYMIEDVPVSLDFRSIENARAWTDSAMSRRPWRAEFFAAFADVIGKAHPGRRCRVLELGSGPGFLAEQLLRETDIDYVAVDFSAAMHELAKERLRPFSPRVDFIERDLRDADWYNGLGGFDFAVTHQAVHELRHKRHASLLHAQVRKLLLPNGGYLVCDHFCGEGGMSDSRLYMTVEEQREALLAAGFRQVDQILLKGGLVLHHAAEPSP